MMCCKALNIFIIFIIFTPMTTATEISMNTEYYGIFMNTLCYAGMNVSCSICSNGMFLHVKWDNQSVVLCITITPHITILRNYSFECQDLQLWLKIVRICEITQDIGPDYISDLTDQTKYLAIFECLLKFNEDNNECDERMAKVIFQPLHDLLCNLMENSHDVYYQIQIQQVSDLLALYSDRPCISYMWAYFKSIVGELLNKNKNND